MGYWNRCNSVVPLEQAYELKRQIEKNMVMPVILIGHSWGALLAGIVAWKNPDIISKVILLGCPPLSTEYISEIDSRRKKNMSWEEGVLFDSLAPALEEGTGRNKGSLLEQLNELAEKSDYYEKDPQKRDADDNFPLEEEVYCKVWPEVEEWRKKGKLLQIFSEIEADMVLIQGEEDPHPYQGVTEPLKKMGIELRVHLIPRCGHKLWEEKYGAEEFYQTLFSELP